MTDTNSTTLRKALASAVKKNVDANYLSAKEGSQIAEVQLSRFYQVLRGEVGKISSDALVNMLGNFGYRLTGINGSGSGTEIVLSLDAAEAVLPQIEKPVDSRDTREEYRNVDPVSALAVPFNEAFGYANNADPDADRVVSTDE